MISEIRPWILVAYSFHLVLTHIWHICLGTYFFHKIKPLLVWLWKKGLSSCQRYGSMSEASSQLPMLQKLWWISMVCLSAVKLSAWVLVAYLNDPDRSGQTIGLKQLSDQGLLCHSICLGVQIVHSLQYVICIHFHMVVCRFVVTQACVLIKPCLRYKWNVRACSRYLTE